MNFKITSRDFKFFIIGVFAMFIFVIIYDWNDFEKGLKGIAPYDEVNTEKVE